MKKFILDTNVIANDPKALYKFADNQVVIPMVVVQELDKLKKRQDGVGHSARQAARELDALRENGRLDKGVRLPNGGSLIVDTEICEPEFKIFGPVQGDHYILQVALNLVKKQKSSKKAGSDVVLVTEDTQLRILADSLGVVVQRYQESAAEDISFYDETKIVVLNPSDLNELALQGGLECDLSHLGLVVNDYVQVTNEMGGSLLARYEDECLRLVPEQRNIFGIHGKNREQHFALHALMDPKISLICLAGKAGCGKTLLALAAALDQTIEAGALYEKVSIARPTISLGKDIGFLPGTLSEKLDPWMGPIYDNAEFLFKGKKGSGRQGLDYLMMDNPQNPPKVEIQALQYIRGRSLSNQLLIIDESQNLSPHEAKTIVTRAGMGTKIVFTFDYTQIDSPYLDQYNNGMTHLIDRLRGQSMFAHINLHKGERSQLAETAAKLL